MHKNAGLEPKPRCWRTAQLGPKELLEQQTLAKGTFSSRGKGLGMQLGLAIAKMHWLIGARSQRFGVGLARHLGGKECVESIALSNGGVGCVFGPPGGHPLRK